MPFHTNNSGYIEGRGRPATGCTCGCSTTAAPSATDSGDLIRAMQALVVNAKIDRALEGAAPLHTQAADAPLLPRGMMHAHRQERTTDDATGPLRSMGLMDMPRRQHRTRHGEIASDEKQAYKPSTSAPLMPRGLMGGR